MQTRTQTPCPDRDAAALLRPAGRRAARRLEGLRRRLGRAPARLDDDRPRRVRVPRRRDRLWQVDLHPPAAEGARGHRRRGPDRRASRCRRSSRRRCRSCAATSAPSSRTTSCSRTAPSTTTSPTRSRSSAHRARRSAARCRTSSRLVGLSTKLHNFPDELSGGEQQRVSIARAFVNHPPLLLCDEPTGNLDPETSIGIMQLIYRINRTGTTVVIATHDKRDGRQDAPARDRAARGPHHPRRALRASTTATSRRPSSPIRLRGELGIGSEGHPN